MGKKKIKPKKEEEAEKPQKIAKPPPPKPAKKIEKTEEGLRGIVRIAGKDIHGKLPLRRALLMIRGFGHTTSRVASYVIEKELGYKPTMRVGELSDEQVEKIDKILYNLHDYGIPSYLMNRRGDFVTGRDMHVIMNDLAFASSQDIEREKKLYTWRGYRHAYGKKVRGQRTRNTGRKGMAVGVLRKAILEQQKASAAKAGGAQAGGGKAQAGEGKK